MADETVSPAPDPLAYLDRIAAEQAAYWGTTPNRWFTVINAWCDEEDKPENFDR